MPPPPGILLPDEVVVVLVRADPVPNVVVAVGHVDGPVSVSDRDGPAACLVTAPPRVVQRMMCESGVVRVRKEPLERSGGSPPNGFRECGQHPLEVPGSDVPSNRPCPPSLPSRPDGSLP